MLVTVAVVGSAHGLRGEVRLELRTDDPGTRLSPGAVLATEPAAPGPLTVASVRHATNGYFVRFEGVPDRTAAEALRGVRLLADTEADRPEPDAWYPHELTGLAVRHADGRELGVVTDLDLGAAQDLLVVREPDGTLSRVPFVATLVPVVDTAAGYVVVDPPRGLFAADPADPD